MYVQTGSSAARYVSTAARSKDGVLDLAVVLLPNGYVSTAIAPVEVL